MHVECHIASERFIEKNIHGASHMSHKWVVLTQSLQEAGAGNTSSQKHSSTLEYFILPIAKPQRGWAFVMSRYKVPFVSH
jgi:hypothetical protein